MKEIKLTGAGLTQLYKNIGEEAGLEKILKRFYHRMSEDIIIGFFFDGKDLDHIAMMQKSFLMRAWGITQSYAGKSPADAHANLAPILKGHFDRRLVVLAETLREFGVSSQDIETWTTFENKFRAAVEKSDK